MTLIFVGYMAFLLIELNLTDYRCMQDACLCACGHLLCNPSICSLIVLCRQNSVMWLLSCRYLLNKLLFCGVLSTYLHTRCHLLTCTCAHSPSLTHSLFLPFPIYFWFTHSYTHTHTHTHTHRHSS